MDTQNVVIIGGGAAGLSAAVYLARAGLAPLVFAGSPPGGQLMLTTEVENFPGTDSVLGPQLIENLRKQAQKFGTTIIDENITSVETSKRPFTVTTGSGKAYTTKALIVATGARALWLGLDSEQRLRGKGVSACATCDAFFFRNKQVAVIGGGDSALEEALTLTKFASKVYVVHRRDTFKASKIMQKRVLEHEKIEVVWNAQIKEVAGANRVEGLVVTLPEGEKTLPVEGVFVAIGHRPDTDLVKGHVELDVKGYLVTTAIAALINFQTPTYSKDQFDVRYQTMTSVSGIFGAGDCVDHVYKQASTAAGLGVQASLDVERWLESQL
jgi:thioredoxin reductase (NADPH)